MKGLDTTNHAANLGGFKPLAQRTLRDPNELISLFFENIVLKLMRIIFDPMLKNSIPSTEGIQLILTILSSLMVPRILGNLLVFIKGTKRNQ